MKTVAVLHVCTLLAVFLFAFDASAESFRLVPVLEPPSVDQLDHCTVGALPQGMTQQGQRACPQTDGKPASGRAKSRVRDPILLES